MSLAARSDSIICHPSPQAEAGGLGFPGQPDLYRNTLSQKNKYLKKSIGIAQCPLGTDQWEESLSVPMGALPPKDVSCGVSSWHSGAPTAPTSSPAASGPVVHHFPDVLFLPIPGSFSASFITKFPEGAERFLAQPQADNNLKQPKQSK